MKIAFVSQPFDNVPPYLNSIGICTYEMARRLTQSCDVIVYAVGPFWRRKAESHGGVNYQRIPIKLDNQLLRVLRHSSIFRSAKRPLFSSKWYYLGYALQIAKDLRKQRCDIVHLNNFSQFAPLIRALNPNIKIVLHMQCEWLTQLDKVMIENRLHHIDFVIGDSEYISGKIRKCFPQIFDRCQTVYNGVDVDHFVRGSHNRQPSENLTKKILFVGRASPEKGVHILLDAFQKVRVKYPNTHLDIVGARGSAPFEFIVPLSDDPKVTNLAQFYQGSYRTYLERKLPQDGKEQVSFTGNLSHSEVRDRYLGADVFVFPSVWNEPFGIPLIEAMAMQLPVVATQSGGMPEIVEQGKTGLLVERGDASALAEAIMHLLSDDNLRTSMGKAGRHRVLEFFSWKKITQDLFSLYQKLCAR